jgi:hypothetical protein
MVPSAVARYLWSNSKRRFPKSAKGSMELLFGLETAVRDVSPLDLCLLKLWGRCTDNAFSEIQMFEDFMDMPRGSSLWKYLPTSIRPPEIP